MANRAGSDQPVWIPPKIWDGETVFVLGGGPSLLESPLSLIHKRRVLAVNDAFREPDGSHRLWADACYFGDCKWWTWNRNNEEQPDGTMKAGFKFYGGLKMTCCQRLYHIPTIKTWKRGKPKGIEDRPGYISWNANSGFSAINVAYQLGSKKIVLLGFDMKYRMNEDETKRIHHWHSWHKSGNSKSSYNARFLPNAPAIATDAKRLGIEIINASVDTAIPDMIFPRRRLEDCL